jgi:hypothetical protein
VARQQSDIQPRGFHSELGPADTPDARSMACMRAPFEPMAQVWQQHAYKQNPGSSHTS